MSACVCLCVYVSVCLCLCLSVCLSVYVGVSVDGITFATRRRFIRRGRGQNPAEKARFLELGLPNKHDARQISRFSLNKEAGKAGAIALRIIVRFCKTSIPRL